MFRFQYFKKFILSSSLAGIGLQGQKKRRGDLSLYEDDDSIESSRESEETEEEKELEKQIGKIREEVWIWYDHVKGYREKVVEVVVTSKQHTEGLIQALRNDELPIPRSGAVAISGLAGFILGLRGGWLKRILYGSTCAGIMAAICYPKETSEYSQEAAAVTKKYVLISYNFIYGVKPEGLKMIHPSELLGGSSKDSGKKIDVNLSANTVSGDKAGKSLKATEKSTTRQNDQSNPADEDLYTNRK